jgi:uncharacterized cupredoxin-like copper-binding protein
MSKVSSFIVACLALGSLAIPSAVASPTLLTTINVTAGKPTELHFVLSKTSAKRGIIVFKFTNVGKLSHDFKLCSSRSSSLAANSCTGRSTKMISHGQSTTLRVTVVLKGSYEYLCTVPGHAAAGMKGLIKVT